MPTTRATRLASAAVAVAKAQNTAKARKIARYMRSVGSIQGRRGGQSTAAAQSRPLFTSDQLRLCAALVDRRCRLSTQFQANPRKAAEPFRIRRLPSETAPANGRPPTPTMETRHE